MNTNLLLLHCLFVVLLRLPWKFDPLKENDMQRNVIDRFTNVASNNFPQRFLIYVRKVMCTDKIMMFKIFCMQVVGADDDRGGVKGERKGMRTSKSSSSPTANSTREDIRKKLASWGEEEEDEDEEEEVENNNLEICFFNETASDDEEEVTRNPLEEEEEEEDYFEEERSGGRGMSRSKSEGFSLRGDPLQESNQAR